MSTGDEHVDQVRQAVALVLKDVEAAGVSDAITVEVRSPEEINSEYQSVAAWVIQDDGSRIGIPMEWTNQPWEEFVVLVADAIQEGVIESRSRWGSTFPPCPTHQTHPMDARVYRVASWVCPYGTRESIPIGSLSEAMR